jgi:hypothetical protein
MENKNYLRITVLALVANLPMAADVMAQERYDDASLQELQRFNLDVGAFFVTIFDTTVRFDSDSVPVGTIIDVEDTLDVDSSFTTGRIDGFYRFNKAHRLDWTYYTSRRSGEEVVTQNIIVGIAGGECVIGAGAASESRLDFDLFKVGYSYSFLNTRKYEMFLGGGLSVRDLDLNIDAEGTLTGCELEDDGSTNISSKDVVPLPTVSFGGRWSFTPKWQARWQWQYFALEFGSYKGRSIDTTFQLEHRTFKNVGFGAGINSFDLRLQGDSSDFRGEIASSYLGLLGYVKVYF